MPIATVLNPFTTRICSQIELALTCPGSTPSSFFLSSILLSLIICCPSRPGSHSDAIASSPHPLLPQPGLPLLCWLFLTLVIYIRLSWLVCRVNFRWLAVSAARLNSRSVSRLSHWSAVSERQWAFMFFSGAAFLFCRQLTEWLRITLVHLSILASSLLFDSLLPLDQQLLHSSDSHSSPFLSTEESIYILAPVLLPNTSSPATPCLAQPPSHPTVSTGCLRISRNTFSLDQSSAPGQGLGL